MVRANTRNYTSELPRINVKQLKTLIINHVQYDITSGNKKITVGVKGDNIAYQLPNDKIVIGRIDKTALSYGWRYWFICPHCHSRRSTLFFTNKNIACRDCFNLHYASQSENQLDRLRRKIVKARYTLFKGKNREYHNLFNHAYYFPKPKGMSRKRFAMEQNKLINMESIYWDHARVYVDKICGKVER
ncbi:hypothetical protein DES39_1892 [Orbus hercynius]|uniref:Uncharacterized protein n=2 Tax=Orbus hercynius TaxID=593135 RepID=A0A495RBQ0_9GAMM|nr:hypothetical protein DES39_1892 [Orbus hercynius]